MKKQRTLRMIVVSMIFVTLFQVAQGQQTRIDQPLHQAAVPVAQDIEWHPKGERLAVASVDELVIYDSSLQELARITTTHHPYTSISWSPDGVYLAVGKGSNVEIYQWDPTTNSLRLTRSMAGDGLQHSVQWDPRGDYIVSLGTQYLESGGVLGTIHVWNTHSWQLERTIPDDQVFVRASYQTQQLLAWNPDGTPTIVAAGYGGKVEEGVISQTTDLIARIIDVTTGQRSQTIALGGPYVLSVLWDPHADAILVGEQTGVTTYDVKSGELTDGYAAIADIQNISLSPDGRYLLIEGAVYDTDSTERLGFFRLTGWVTASEWSPDGSKIAVFDSSGVGRIENPTLVPGVVINEVPTAQAGADQTVTDSDNNGSERVMLDGSGSSDSDGSIESYSWQEEGEEIASGVNPTVDLAIGTHTITLVVTDDDGATARDEVVIEVVRPSQSPSAPAVTPEITAEVTPDAGSAPSVTGFVLVDADADADLRPLEDGDTITEGTITIRVETAPPIVGSVVFGLDDEPRFKVENEDAYALKGDDNGDYHAWLAEPGTYTLTATPYTEADGQGEAGTPLTIRFTVAEPGS